ncbi:hypothetical protein [Solilutibacter silvestris]|uniref:hypothetical protein n=1 Tax=Solilutibacter silvestris TaxID=1645665 RepID=UPI003D335B00
MISLQAQPNSQALVFKSEGHALGSSPLGVLAATVLLLAVAYVALRYAKKRGWLDRWLGQAAQAPAAQTLQVVERVRLSPKTTVYKVRDGEGTALVVESTASVTVVNQPPVGGLSDGA